jgi:hypothetical protein
MGRTGRWKSAWLPRGARPRVGQGVAYSKFDGEDATTYLVGWDKPPQYGTAPAPRLDAAHRLLEAKRALDRGLITQADFGQVRQSPPDGSAADDGGG